MTVQFPEHQAADNFPETTDYSPAGVHHDAVTTARKVWKEHLAKDDWEGLCARDCVVIINKLMASQDLGSKDGVALAKKPNPEGCRPPQFVAQVQLLTSSQTPMVFRSSKE